MMRKTIGGLLVVVLSIGTAAADNVKSMYRKGWIDFNKNGVMDIYEDPNAAVEARIADLLGQMTLDEKTCQMATLYGSGRVLKDKYPTENWKNEIWKDGIGNIDEQGNGVQDGMNYELSFPWTKSIQNRHEIQRWFVEQTRLGIPVDFTNEGIRGLCHDQATSFPAQCAQGSTWDRELIAEIARITAEEAHALGYTNIYSPILDLSQDPRWGRVVESYGEDPYLVGELGKQAVLGLQSQHVVSTPKHFAVYSIPVGGRDGGTRTDPHIAPREVRTIYLEPFRKAFQEAGALGTMASYNDYNGEPIIGSYHFMTEILRQEWGFKGYVVSDSKAVEYLYDKHHVVESEEEMAAQVVNAGMNIRTNFTPPQDFILPLRRAIEKGLVSQRTIDQRVSEILRVKFFMGLFDDPYPGDEKHPEAVVHTPEHQAVSLRAALESMVLLKNEGQLLPLSKSLKKIAVIGPNADETTKLISRYGPARAPIKSVYQGIKEYLPNADVRYAKGCDIIDKYFPESELYEVPLDADEQRMIDEAVALARQSEVAIMVMGGNESTVRESYSRTSLDMCGRQEQLLKAVYATGTPVVLLLVDGRAATINWADKYVPAIMQCFFQAEFTGQAIAQAVFGDYNPGGHLTVTYPKSVGQIPFAFPFKPGSDSPGTVRVAGVLYPFGHGLSYTTFEYSDLQISKPVIGPYENFTVSCVVKNTGSREGDEVAQLYLHDDVSSVITYVKVLRGFERIHLQPGEQRRVEFQLTPQELGLWNKDEKFVVEPGTFSVEVGSSSTDIRLKGSFLVQ